MENASLEFLASNLMDNQDVHGLLLEDRSTTVTATMLDDAYQNLNLHEFRQQHYALQDVLTETVGETDDVFLKFDEAGIYLRKNKLCSLSLITDRDANVKALRISTKLMLRQVTKQNLTAMQGEALDPAFAAPRTLQPVTSGSPTKPKPASKPPFPQRRAPATPKADNAASDGKRRKRRQQSDGIWG